MQETQAQYRQEQETDNHPVPAVQTWVKPEFQVIGVSLECTAYAATLELED
ncbi:MAG TPA: hypothetical protein VL461_15900 [Dictyobacter sp.]|jgi:hypothetical protein|nr:hypothetical protein [Dictyobacter sp.]